MATDFYGRNDMDMLQLGNGDLSIDEAKAHFTAWALMKSTLLIGTDSKPHTTSNRRPPLIKCGQCATYHRTSSTS